MEVGDAIAGRRTEAAAESEPFRITIMSTE